MTARERIRNAAFYFAISLPIALSAASAPSRSSSQTPTPPQFQSIRKYLSVRADNYLSGMTLAIWLANLLAFGAELPIMRTNTFDFRKKTPANASLVVLL